MPNEVDLLRHDGKTCCEAYAVARLGVVEYAKSGGRRTAIDRAWSGRTGHAAGVDSIAEIADDTDDFVMTPAGIERRLNEEVGRPVRRVASAIKGVVQTTPRAGSIHEEARRASR